MRLRHLRVKTPILKFVNVVMVCSPPSFETGSFRSHGTKYISLNLWLGKNIGFEMILTSASSSTTFFFQKCQISFFQCVSKRCLFFYDQLKKSGKSSFNELFSITNLSRTDQVLFFDLFAAFSWQWPMEFQNLFLSWLKKSSAFSWTTLAEICWCCVSQSSHVV